MSDRHSGSDVDDEDAIFAQLEAELDDDTNDAAFREVGIDALRKEMELAKSMKDGGHGRYDEIMNEKEVIRISANEPRCVIHFYHHNFKRCEIMDRHLAALAPKYFSTRFLRVFVENVPWLVEKLEIKVLPCVMCFADGVAKDRLVGFEDLGNEDAFKTGTLELRLSQSGILQKAAQALPTYSARGTQASIFDKRAGARKLRIRDDSDDELDI